MKAIISGIAIAVIVAVGAAYVLDTKVQQTAETAFTTTRARLSTAPLRSAAATGRPRSSAT